jgi:hypothetical protein
MAEFQDSKAALIAELSRARADMARNSQGLRGGVNVGGRVQSGFERHRGAWLSGAALLGLILGKVPPRTKRVPMNSKDRGKFAQQAGKAGFFMGILKLVIDFAKPLMIAWATKRMGDVAKSTKQVERKVDRVEEKSDEIHEATT